MYDLCYLSDEENEGKKEQSKSSTKEKKLQIIKVFLDMYRNEDEEDKKMKIKYCIKALDDKNKEIMS